MPDVVSDLVSGIQPSAYRRGGASTAGDDQYVIVREDRVVTYRGLAASPLIPGRAAVRQPLMTVHNVTGSTVLVNVERIKVDLLQLSAAVANTVTPGVIRLARFTGAPTGGTANTKGGEDTTLTSNANVVVTNDANGDNTSATTALAFTSGTILNQTFAPRMVQLTATAANLPAYEPVDIAEFLYGEPDVVVRAGEGLGIVLEQSIAAGNPTTHRWAVTLAWSEYTRP